MSGEFHVALVSGGMDSAAAAHKSITDGPCEVVVYLDTGTGVDANREYVMELAREFGVQPWILGTHESYEEKVKEHGFPGPSRHFMMYSSLKERQIGKLATAVNGKGNTSNLHLWTGVRRQESQRRMKHVEKEQEGKRWTWHAPLYNWNKEQVRLYINENDIPRNPLWDTLGRSADCFCGCFGSPEEKLDLRAAGEGQHAEWIEALEGAVDREDEKGRWAWGGMSEPQRRAVRAEDRDMTLCSSCGIPEPED